MTPEEVLKAFENNARVEAKEALDVKLGVINGLLKPMLQQGLIDLSNEDAASLEDTLNSHR